MSNSVSFAEPRVVLVLVPSEYADSKLDTHNSTSTIIKSRTKCRPCINRMQGTARGCSTNCLWRPRRRIGQCQQYYCQHAYYSEMVDQALTQHRFQLMSQTSLVAVKTWPRRVSMTAEIPPARSATRPQRRMLGELGIGLWKREKQEQPHARRTLRTHKPALIVRQHSGRRASSQPTPCASAFACHWASKASLTCPLTLLLAPGTAHRLLHPPTSQLRHHLRAVPTAQLQSTHHRPCRSSTAPSRVLTCSSPFLPHVPPTFTPLTSLCNSSRAHDKHSPRSQPCTSRMSLYHDRHHHVPRNLLRKLSCSRGNTASSSP